MKRSLLFAAPVLAVGVLIWGCSSNDSTVGERQGSSLVSPTENSDVTGPGDHHGGSHDGGMGDHMDGGMGGNHEGMGGHHGDMGACDPDSCSCADHENCGGMMGGGMGEMECDPECPGCGANCDGMDGGHDHGSHHESTECVDQDHGGDGHGRH